MFKKKRVAAAVAAVALSLGAALGATAPAQAATDDSYRIPQCSKGNGPGIKSWNGYSKQDGWNRWFYTKAGCTTAAVDHWYDVRS